MFWNDILEHAKEEEEQEEQEKEIRLFKGNPRKGGALVRPKLRKFSEPHNP